MGMFDYIVVDNFERFLTDNDPEFSTSFQSKSFDRLLQEIKISEDGYLYKLDEDKEWIPPEPDHHPLDFGDWRVLSAEWKLFDFTGEFSVYANSKERDSEGRYAWLELKGLAVHGKVEKLVRIDDRNLV